MTALTSPSNTEAPSTTVHPDHSKPTAETTTSTHVTTSSGLSEMEKRRLRREHFGLTVSDLPEETRKKMREERFAGSLSSPKQTTNVHEASSSKTVASAAEGSVGSNGKPTPTTSTKTTSLNIDPEILKSRMERFGTVNPSVEKRLAQAELEKKKKERLARFGVSESEVQESVKMHPYRHGKNHRRYNKNY